MVELLANKVELLANNQNADGEGAFLTEMEADVTPPNLARRLSPSPEVLQMAMVDALSKDGSEGGKRPSIVASTMRRMTPSPDVLQMAMVNVLSSEEGGVAKEVVEASSPRFGTPSPGP